MCLLLTACMPEEGNGGRGRTSKNNSTNSNNPSDGSGNGGTGSLPGDTVIDGSGQEALQSLRVELTHLVDPFTGTYKKKITIPKNFTGELNISGINLTALRSKILKVRIFTGHNLQSDIVLDATINKAPGIVPDQGIQVLSVNMNSAPFSSMTLPYDLYDYNDYGANPSLEPVTGNRDGGLYCRGLDLKYDPTFSGPTSSGALTCTSSDVKCLYAYAKIQDSTLYDDATKLTLTPSLPQVWMANVTGSSTIFKPTIGESLQGMCLPDRMDSAGLANIFGINGITLGDTFIQSGKTYQYRGPYRETAKSLWRIGGSAIFNSKYGIYKASQIIPNESNVAGFQSLLFPLAGKMSLSANKKYLGSDDFFGLRSDFETTLMNTTNYMDGCNLRVSSYNPQTNEGVGSCNVSAYIEVFYIQDGKEVVVTKDHTLKVQIVRASITNYLGQEVLASSFNSCETSATCGGSECCFNKRCWSKDLVSSCLEDFKGTGNLVVGESCSSDFECASLCCNQTIGACSPHNPNAAVPVLCNKAATQSCVTKEFCKPEFIQVYQKVKLPNLSSTGKVQCTIRSTAVETYGACTSGKCIPPVQPPQPQFDLTDCSDAVDP